MTTKTLDWLNQNRYRAYPFINDGGLLCNGKRVPDCVLLDCLVVDTRHDIGIPRLEFTRYDVRQGGTTVYFNYNGVALQYELTSGMSGTCDDGSCVRVSGSIGSGPDSAYVSLYITFSSHGYILEHAGTGTWDFSGIVYPSKIISVTASGVSGIATNGSETVRSEGVASGNVHLVDGYRTQPSIKNGKVYLKVGNAYGIDPCHYPREQATRVSCDDLLFFFCGQNAINSGNVILSGGPGVSVKQGRTYTAREDIYDTYGNIGIRKGESIPCVEIVASSELLRIYRPTDPDNQPG